MSEPQSSSDTVRIRPTQPADFEAIIALCRRVYPMQKPWRLDQLEAQRESFPEGQFVAADASTDQLLGMAACLVVDWDDYEIDDSYRDVTDGGRFGTHDSRGRTLYGAEVMVDPQARRRGIGHEIYEARRQLVRRLKLARIRAGARLPGLHEHPELDPEDYVVEVVHGRLRDPTLTFQLREGFRVLAVTRDYLRDPKSRNCAAVIEWQNMDVPRSTAVDPRNPRFAPPPGLWPEV